MHTASHDGVSIKAGDGDGTGGCHDVFLLVIDGGWGAFRPAWSVINRMCADCPCRHQRSKGGQRPNEDIKADPGAGVPAISGDEPYSAVTFDGWSRCDTEAGGDQEEPTNRVPI